jgi:hypothetical protein
MQIRTGKQEQVSPKRKRRIKKQYAKTEKKRLGPDGTKAEMDGRGGRSSSHTTTVASSRWRLYRNVLLKALNCHANTLLSSIRFGALYYDLLGLCMITGVLDKYSASVFLSRR